MSFESKLHAALLVAFVTLVGVAFTSVTPTEDPPQHAAKVSGPPDQT